MNFFIKTTPIEKIDADLLVLFSWQDDLFHTASLISSLSSIILRSAKKEKFEGKDGDSLSLFTQGQIGSYKLLILGMGQEKEFDLYKLRKMVAIVTKKAREIKVSRFAIKIPDNWMSRMIQDYDIQVRVFNCMPHESGGGRGLMKLSSNENLDAVLDVIRNRRDVIKTSFSRVTDRTVMARSLLINAQPARR